MAASAPNIDEFLAGPLVTWLATCLKKPESLQVYETFFDGGPLAEVLLQIDPEPSQPIPSSSNLQGLSITSTRIKIFHCIIRNIKTIYEEELGQVIVSLPDCVTLGRSPGSEQALEQLKLLVLLLLGCAVQGPTKEHFITKIKRLPVDAQHDIVECIKRVTDDQTIVLTADWTEQSAQRLYTHVRTLTGERDKLFQQWMVDLSQEPVSTSTNTEEGIESNHLAVELADWKSRLRKQRQELEEKSELLAECREELDHATNLIAKLKSENCDLLGEARKAKAYRDEVDAMRERAERVDRLESEAQRYRERLADAEFYKVRVDELREDNRVLLETREMLEAQLARARQRCDHALELEAELLSSKQQFNEILLERDAAKERIQELLDENFQLQHVTKSALQESSNVTIVDDSDHDETNSGDNSLSEQLTNNAQARALRLELENKKLLSTIDLLKERGVHDNANKMLELEKEKKRLALKCEQLQENCEKFTCQNSELEALFKNAIQENRKLQDSIDTAKVLSDRQSQDLSNERIKITELEKSIDGLTKEKQRVQTLCDTIKKRADDAEKSLNQISNELLAVQSEADQGKLLEKLGNELKDKISALEKENASMLKEITKFKELIEIKDVKLDESCEILKRNEKEIQNLSNENKKVSNQLEKLQEFEQKSQELMSQLSVHSATISTLQNDLINEKVNNDRFKTNLEKLGLNLDLLDNDINVVVEQMLNNSEISKIISSILNCKKENVDKDKIVEDVASEWSQQVERLTGDVATLQNLNECLKTDNAKMQVEVSTLKSQVHSLQTQQTALQLANSQLVAEKDELSKQQQLQNDQHDTLLLDQVTLRTLHEQLNSEYESLKNEEESLKRLNRDLRSEIRTLKDTNDNRATTILSLENEKESFKNDAKNLGILRTEHSKLKDDFRNLFTASERLKLEYRSVQDELKSLRAESRTLRLGHTEMQGELNTRSDLVAGLQLENTKLQQKYNMMYEMNQTLDSDRRVLMDNVSQLLSQYHSLLTHSLEDKQQYHLEEKLYADKVNNLCRQKEKLEEKIMEHYRKLDNASSKKKGFGATLVRRVRKAGSDIINKVPSRNRRSWHEDATRLTQSQFTLGGGSGESAGNDSDNSIDDNSGQKGEHFRRSTSGSLHGQRPRDEVALRRSHRDMAAHRNSIASCRSEIVVSSSTPTTAVGAAAPAPGSAMSLGSVGSRRTVYLSEDEPNAPSSQPTSHTSPQSGNNQSQPPLLVYNRISTVIGGDSSQPRQNSTKIGEDSSNNKDGDKKRAENSKETAVWYEYGCV